MSLPAGADRVLYEYIANYLADPDPKGRVVSLEQGLISAIEFNDQICKVENEVQR